MLDVPDLTIKIYSTTQALERGVRACFESGNSSLQKGGNNSSSIPNPQQRPWTGVVHREYQADRQKELEASASGAIMTATATKESVDI